MMDEKRPGDGATHHPAPTVLVIPRAKAILRPLAPRPNLRDKGFSIINTFDSDDVTHPIAVMLDDPAIGHGIRLAGLADEMR